MAEILGHPQGYGRDGSSLVSMSVTGLGRKSGHGACECPHQNCHAERVVIGRSVTELGGYNLYPKKLG